MFLDNSLMQQGICNGTIGIITDLDIENENVCIAFSIRSSIINSTIYKKTHYFELHKNNCKRTQYPLQNSFALTVHKIQSLTLPKVSLVLDQNILHQDKHMLHLADVLHRKMLISHTSTYQPL